MGLNLWEGNKAKRVVAALEELARLGVDYELLNNKPSIGGVTLVGNKTLANLGIPTQAAVDAKYTKPSGGIPKSDLVSGVQTSLGLADTAYQKPGSGVPLSDLASGVQTSLGKADSAYQKPGTGIPSSDMASAVQTSLGLADTAYQKPASGIPASDLASGVIPDISGKADKDGTILTSYLSNGRFTDSTIGENSIAWGNGVTASGQYAIASGTESVASGNCSRSYGYHTVASNVYSLSEGYETVASGRMAHAEGDTTVANLNGMHAEGAFNVVPTPYSDWVANTHYNVGDKRIFNGWGVVCKTENTDAEFNFDHWAWAASTGPVAYVIGNGDSDARSNAYMVDWDGNVYVNGVVRVNCNADSSGGTVLPHDVQVNGTSIVSNGVANIPYASSSEFGLVSISSGLAKNDQTNKIYVQGASAPQIKAGSDVNFPIVSGRQHQSIYYGLSKLAGVDLANESVTVGTYPASSKTAIKTMLGVIDPTVSDVQVNGTSILQNGVANIPVADTNNHGVVKVAGGIRGIEIDDGFLQIAYASSGYVKGGSDARKPIVPYTQHESTFYGLAKVAGVDLANQTVTLGQYPNSAKSAIQTMIGVENAVTFVQEVTGTAVTITGEPNVKYMCGEVYSISITAPESGTIDVWFTSGSSPAVLTTTGVTFPEWFDPDYLDANTVYEIVITDGYGGVATWEAPVSV